MTKREHFIDLGLFVRPNFLPLTLCEAACEEMRMSQPKVGTILDNAQELVDEQIRKAKNVITVASPTRRAITERLDAIAPDVAEHFGCALTGMQELQFLNYDEGDFFVFHRDKTDTPDEPAWVSERKVSAVIFLNAGPAHHNLNSYSGGTLEFYAHDLIAEPMYKQAKIPLPATPGTLVAFDPLVRHQVQPVTHGQRFTVVTWFV
jgi:predicted 2-oxoglutarate/Fe(II)-dependent dioxygenase YbiX